MKRAFHSYQPDLTKHARRLRQNATFPERLLWSRLRRRQLGRRFLRQHPVASFVVDFYCPEACLAIELDGRSHDGRFQYDTDRQTALEELGIRLIRFTNDEVLQNVDSVVAQIASCLPDAPPL